ncbi:hypothetical protein ABL57_16790 [Kocuria sp. SM24M-10]|nr:hypothetical protein ABL57_16790 [Kocuria sp. SM24M-10]
MSRPLTASITWSRAEEGSAPGWENTRMPSRKAMSVGIEEICAEAASICWSSVSTFPKTMSSCFSEAAS